jgi:glutathione S-transferase
MCPFAQKVHICLNLTQKPFAVEEIDLYGNKPKSFLRLNPAGKVPVLRHKNDVITESERILDFIADGTDDFKSDKCRSLHVTDRELELWWRSTIDGDLKTRGKQAVLSGALTPDLREVLGRCEGRIPLTMPTFLAGSSISLADVCAFPFLWRLDDEYDFAGSGYPNLKRWLDHVGRIDAFKRTVVSSWWWWW